MINSALLRKSYYEARWLWLTCAAVLFVFCWVHVGITSQVDMGRFESILRTLPEQWEKFSPVPFEKLISYPARIAVIYEEPLVYLLMTVWCISRGSDCVSGELGRGTMEMLVSQPVSRLQILLTPIVVTVVGVALLAAVAWLGTCTGIATTSIERPAEGSTWTIPFTAIQFARENAEMERIPMSHLASFRQFVPAALNYCSLGIFMAGICTLLSALDRYRWRTIGLMMAFYVGSMLAEIVGQAFPKLAFVRHVSFFSVYEPIKFVSEANAEPAVAWSWWLRDAQGAVIDLGPLAGDALLAGLGFAGFVLAAIIFCRRDVPAPL